MKTLGYVVIAFALSFSTPAFAVTMDRETHDALISQLQEVRENLKPSDVSYVPTSLRLADLLADRARLTEVQVGDGKPANPAEVKSDRLKAIALIDSVNTSLNSEQKGKAHLQKAQLLQLTGQDEQSIQMLNVVRQESPRTEEYWVATDLLADLYFSKAEYAKSQKFYEELNRSSKRAPFHEYRLAWCDLNQGREAKAVSRMENLLAGKIDEGLRKEATRDLVIFYARRPYSPNNIVKIKKYSSQSSSDVSENLRVYGEELKRLGKKKESANVFVTYLGSADKKEDTLDSQADLFENLVDVGRRSEALKVLEKIVSVPCKDSCADVQHKIHRTLHNWAAEEKDRPSANLMQAFSLYSRQTPIDGNALLLGIKTAQEGNRHREALSLLATLIAQSKDPQAIETALKAQIASAEKSKDAAARENAYRSYIQRGQDASIKQQSTVALINVLAERKNYAEAETIALQALNQKQNKEIGDLLLEIYSKSGQFEKSRALALRLSKGDGNSDYYKEYKRLSLLVVKKNIDTEKATATDLATLRELAQKSHNPAEQFRILNDAFLVALHLQDFVALKQIGDQLVSTASRLGSKEKQLAYEKRMYVADLELDFATSLRFERMMNKKQSGEQFRMALKSRLSGHPDMNLERKILTQGGSTMEQKMWVLEQQVIDSSRPLDLLKKYKNVARSSRDFHSRLSLMALGRSNPQQVQKYVLSNSSLRGTFIDALMRRRLVLSDMDRDFKRLSRKKISTASMPAFDRSLNEYLDGLNRFERHYTAGNDAVIQLAAKSDFLVLNRKLQSDLAAAQNRLKVPTKIKIAFSKGLSTQLTVLANKIANGERDLSTEWQQQQMDKSLDTVLKTANQLQKRAVSEEIALWRSFSQAPLQEKWAQLLRNIGESSVGSNKAQLSGLYGELKKNPFRRELVKKLAQEEEARGNHLVATFLSERERIGGL